MNAEKIINCEYSRGAEGHTPLDASLIILAGGRGRRMGSENKLYMEIDGARLAEKILIKTAPLFKETIIAVSRGESKRALSHLAGIPLKNIRIEEDSREGAGPIEGLRRGLDVMSSDWGFFAGCDMPCIDEKTVLLLYKHCSQKTDAVCAKINGFIEPLHAFYRKTCAEHVKYSIECGNGQIKSFFAAINLTLVSEEELEKNGGKKSSFFNLNTPCDVEKFKTLRHQS